MPNGNPDFDPKAAEQWFAPIAGVLESFAQRHNLLVDRYYHDSSSWTFRFNHPRGGQASVGVSCNAGETASIYSSWHVDDYDRFTRSIHWRKSREVSKGANALLEEMELELSAILAVPLVVSSFCGKADSLGKRLSFPEASSSTSRILMRT